MADGRDFIIVKLGFWKHIQTKSKSDTHRHTHTHSQTLTYTYTEAEKIKSYHGEKKKRILDH